MNSNIEKILIKVPEYFEELLVILEKKDQSNAIITNNMVRRTSVWK